MYTWLFSFFVQICEYLATAPLSPFLSLYLCFFFFKLAELHHLSTYALEAAEAPLGADWLGITAVGHGVHLSRDQGSLLC